MPTDKFALTRDKFVLTKDKFVMNGVKFSLPIDNLALNGDKIV